MLSSLGKQLTFNGENELVGRIHDLYETTAVAALGHLLCIPQHTTCNIHVSVDRCNTGTACMCLLLSTVIAAMLHALCITIWDSGKVKLTGGATDKHLERGQDSAVERPGQACNGAGTRPLQGKAQPVVSVLQDSNQANY